MRKTRKDEKGIEELKIKQSNKMSSIDNIGDCETIYSFY